MARLLVVNPNSSAAITARVAEVVAETLPQVEIDARTMPGGPPYIGSPAELRECLAPVHAAIGAAADRIDAALIACFDGAGLEAMRTRHGIPVVTLADSAITLMGLTGRRFAIVTGGEVWKAPITALVTRLGHAGCFTGVRTLADDALALSRASDGGRAALLETIAACGERDGAEAVLLAGAGFAGRAAELGPSASLPLSDCAVLAARMIGALLARR